VAIALAPTEKAKVLGIDDKNEINACKLSGASRWSISRSKDVSWTATQ